MEVDELLSGELIAVPSVPQVDAWLADRLGDDFRLEGNEPELCEIAVLVGGWYQHVAKLRADLSCDDDDRTVWGAYDLVATVALRGRLERKLGRLRSGHHRRVMAAVDEVDNTFRQFTEIDHEGRLARLDGSRPDPSSWWWNRLPTSGPARRELDRIIP